MIFHFLIFQEINLLIPSQSHGIVNLERQMRRENQPIYAQWYFFVIPSLV